MYLLHCEGLSSASCFLGHCLGIAARKLFSHRSFVGLYHNTGLCPSVEEFAEPGGFGREAAEVKNCLLAAVAGLKLLGCKR